MASNPGAPRRPPSRSISSQSGGRPPSSAGSSRPPSSLSGPSRPSSSASVTRPLSRVSQSRPASSMTYRPGSAGGNYRPASRINRPPSRAAQRNRLMPLYQTLVNQVTGLGEGGDKEDGDADERVANLVEYVAKQLESTTMNKASASQDMSTMDQIISGHALKARVNLQETLSNSLEHCYSKLKKHIDDLEKDLDSEIKANRLPDHLQLLVALSQSPTASTLAYADLYMEDVKNPPPGPQPLTWKQILDEEPFEGDHWEGILDPINVDDWDSTPSLSPLNSDDLALDDEDSDDSYYARANGKVVETASPPPRPKEDILPHPQEDPSLFEELEAKQYWREDWQTDANTDSAFDLGDPSTLGPSLARVAAKGREGRYMLNSAAQERYIDEEDMVREVLMALQGRENIALAYANGCYGPTLSTPRLVHLSPDAQSSILSSFSKLATTVQSLRSFSAVVFSGSWAPYTQRGESSSGHAPLSSGSPLTRTSEAFADAVDQEIRRFDAWCASREEDICRACQGLTDPLVVSLLETQSAVSKEYEAAFDVMLEIVRNVFRISTSASKEELEPALVVQTKGSPAAHSTLLLDTIFSTLLGYTERNSPIVSQMLLRLFIRTAEPIWSMLGSWLKDGMSVVESGYGDHGRTEKRCNLEEEFFIESSGVGIGMMSMGLLDPDFWKEGYCLRETYIHVAGEDTFREQKKVLVPEFLKHVADAVLETGKAVGLVRALGLELAAGKRLGDLPTFEEVVSLSLSAEIDHGSKESVERTSTDAVLSSSFGVSGDSLSRVVYDQLSPVCEAIGDELVKIIVEDCELWKHVNAIEDLFFMRKGDVLTHFIDLVFTKIETNLSWADFHFLNSAFSDAVRASHGATPNYEWIQLSLVRLSHRNHRDAARYIHRTVRAFEGLQIEFAVPFPLTYIFRPDVMQHCSEVFVLLMQIRRAKGVLERILVRALGEGQSYREEMKVFYAMRSRLSWFVNTLLTFLTTYVMRVEILKFHEKLHAARSLDEIIQLHDQHVDHIRARCFLASNNEVLHKAIVSILDMCLHFSGMFTSYAGEGTATHDVSRHSITLKHRSRRLRRQQRNVIGFTSTSAPPPSASFRDMDSSDDDDDEENESAGPPETSFSVHDDTGYGGDTLAGLEQMSKELDGLVRFVRRGVEALSGGAGEEAATFGVLAFALEDWDL